MRRLSRCYDNTIQASSTTRRSTTTTTTLIHSPIHPYIYAPSRPPAHPTRHNNHHPRIGSPYYRYCSAINGIPLFCIRLRRRRCSNTNNSSGYICRSCNSSSIFRSSQLGIRQQLRDHRRHHRQQQHQRHRRRSASLFLPAAADVRTSFELVVVVDDRTASAATVAGRTEGRTDGRRWSPAVGSAIPCARACSLSDVLPPPTRTDDEDTRSGRQSSAEFSCAAVKNNVGWLPPRLLLLPLLSQPLRQLQPKLPTHLLRQLLHRLPFLLLLLLLIRCLLLVLHLRYGIVLALIPDVRNPSDLTYV